MERRETTRKLLAGLASAGSGADAPEPTAAAGGARVLFVAGPCEQQAGRCMRQVSSMGRFGFAVQALLPGQEPSPGWNGCAAVVCSEAFAFAAELALGLQITPQARAMAQGLWNGVPLYLPTIEEAAAAPRPLLEKYREYTEALTGMGVRFVQEGRFLARLMEDLLPQKEDTAAGQPAPAGRRVVTQKDIAARRDGGVWRLPPETIITPLARDEAAKRGIVLQRRTE